MKIQFLIDTQKHRAGDIVDADKDYAIGLIQEGVAQIWYQNLMDKLLKNYECEMVADFGEKRSER